MIRRHLSLRRLQVLRTIADPGSMARAARVQQMTGPAVTQRVRHLERTLASLGTGTTILPPAAEPRPT